MRGPGRCEALEGPRPSMRVSGAISDSSRVGYRSPFCRPEHELTKLPDGPARRPMTAEEYFISSRSFNHKSYNLLFSPPRALEMSGPDSKDNQTVSEINIPTQRAGLCLKSLIDVWPLAQAQPGLDCDTSAPSLCDTGSAKSYVIICETCSLLSLFPEVAATARDWR